MILDSLIGYDIGMIVIGESYACPFMHCSRIRGSSESRAYHQERE